MYFPAVRNFPKVRRFILLAFLAMGFLMIFTSIAAGEQPHRVSKVLTTTIYVAPKVELTLDQSRVDKHTLSLEVDEFLDKMSLENQNITLDKDFRNGRETLIVTKVMD